MCSEAGTKRTLELHAIVNEEDFAWKKRKKKKQGENTFVYVWFFQVLVVVI
jgi:hypothetical protein